MTDEQLQRRLNGIRSLSESLNEEGYTVFRSPCPSAACHDIRFLLNYIDGLDSKIKTLEVQRQKPSNS